MGTITATITRGGDLTVPVAFAYSGAGYGANPLSANDHLGGAFPSGTGTIAANATTGTFTFASNPDTTVEPDEQGIITLTSTTANVTISPNTMIYTFTNDDTASGGTTFGPADTADSGFVPTGSQYQKASWTFGTGQLTADLYFGFDATGQNGIIVGQNSDGIWIARTVKNGVTTNNQPFAFAPTAGTVSGELGTDLVIRLKGPGATAAAPSNLWSGAGITPGNYARFKVTAAGTRSTGKDVVVAPFSGAIS